MQKEDYILLIMNCKKYKDKAERQTNTWLKTISMKYYHVIGDPLLDTEYRFEEGIRPILYVKVEDDYISLPKKVIRAYKAICSAFNFKYVFKTDDDQMLLNASFLNIVKTLTTTSIISPSIPQMHYGGQVVNVNNNFLSQYNALHPELPSYLPIYKTTYCSGRFYFLSNEAIQALLTKQYLIETEFFEDYSIGFYLPAKYKTNIRHLATTSYFVDME
jgi:hypothetical protein